MILGVGHEERLAGQAHSLGTVEPCRGEVAVDEALAARADHHGRFSFKVVWTIRLWPVSEMNSRLPGASARTLPGKSSGTGRDLVHLGLECDRFEVEPALVGCGELADLSVEHVEWQLPAARLVEATIRGDEHDGRPALDAEPLPDRHVGVVDDRVLDPVLGHLAADVLAVPLGVEFPRVDTDDHQLVLVLLLELRQGRQDVVAVDAAVSPEIEEDDLPLELGQRNRSGVDPLDAALETRQIVLAESDQPNQGRVFDLTACEVAMSGEDFPGCERDQQPEKKNQNQPGPQGLCEDKSASHARIPHGGD